MKSETPYLPAELLSEIFRLAKPKREPSHAIPLQVVLSHVSSDWRNAVLSDSRLWSAINIYSPKSFGRAEAFLSRTGVATPLHVRIEAYRFDRFTKDPTKRAEFVVATRAFLKSSIHRCKTLLILTYDSGLADQILQGLTESEAPTLQRLRIKNVEHNALPVQTFASGAQILTAGAPALTFLETEGLHLLPPIASLVTLHLHNIDPVWFSYDTFSDIVNRAPKLENLSLECHDYISNWPMHFAGSALTLKNLRALRIIEQGSGLIVRYLLSINAPRLESLWISTGNTAFDHLFSSPQFLDSQHKYGALKYLTLETFNMKTTSKFAHVFPNVVHLYLADAPLFHVKHLEQAFTADPPIWPKLQTLAVSSKSDRREMQFKEALCNIVTRRAEKRLPLKRCLADGNLAAFLKNQASDLLNENITVAEMDALTHREPWWVMMHEDTMDSLGFS
ncbi:hypothetical protein FA15DRAFT_476076 [Coprinopsis marcescibilis]|uniref:Uncharacterized protein n=1 Tax=Coprinopsis marcescibilis TaxID=230819 RepID=A0A5C3KRC5_COPMA|nr:hypothetical protein FA15DRAFT_476076 [Coprinopsis marcescibilis]